MRWNNMAYVTDEKVDIANRVFRFAGVSVMCHCLDDSFVLCLIGHRQ
jgi:hypothetical protein